MSSINGIEEVFSCLQRCFTVNQEILQALAGDANADSAHFFTADFDFDLTRMVDENTVFSIRDVEWYTFICLFARSAPILIPDAHRLTYKYVLS